MTESERSADLPARQGAAEHTDRTLMCFQPGTPLSRFLEVRRLLPHFADDVRLADDVAERTVIFPEWGIVVAPLPLSRVLDAIDTGVLWDVRSADWEGISYIPPGRFIPPDGPITSDVLGKLGVTMSGATGKGVTVAILDTGLDFNHPDFKGDPRIRALPSIPAAQDNIGHGTHVTGLACGPKYPADGSSRYGIAYESQVLIKRVTQAGGVDDSVLIAAMTDARDAGANIIVLSMGGNLSRCPDCLSQVAQRLLEVDKVLLIAAAGNDAPDVEDPVGYPASCIPIMAVAGLNSNLQAWDLSCVSIGQPGDEIDLSAPGQGIVSARLGGGRVAKSGTSMANALAAGVAALWAQSGLRGKDLKAALVANVQPVYGLPYQVGPGMIQAPP